MEGVAQTDDHTALHSPGDTKRAEMGDLFSIKSISPLDKVRQFFEDQEVRLEAAQEVHEGLERPGREEDIQDIQNSLFHGDDAALDEEERLFAPETRLKKKRRGANNGKGEVVSKKACNETSSRGGATRKGTSSREKKTWKPLALFRQSQKTLRKEAQHVNMKEVISRSLTGISESANEFSNPFAPTGLSQSSSTWSSTIATDITNRFLSNIQQRKRETVERMLHRETITSQLPLLCSTEGNEEENGVILELVIGDDCDSAVATPATADTAFPISDDAAPELTMATATSTSTTLDNLFTSGASQSMIELDEETEQEQSEALMRKHELRRLRQKYLRAQRDEESNSQMGNADHRYHDSQMSNTSRSMTQQLTTARTHTSAVGENDGCFDVLMTQRSVIKETSGKTFQLSDDHIDMLRRVNSFDNVASKRIVVFEAKKNQ